MRGLSLAAAVGAVILSFPPRVAGQKPGDVPVDFTANAEVKTALATATTTLTIHIDSYTTERDRTLLLNALRTNGYQSFLPVFKKTPVVGYVQIKEQKWNLRWAASTVDGTKRLVTAATDQPMFFLGGGAEPKSRRGYDMAVIRFELDASGTGTGTLAAAARVKPNTDSTNVIVDDYSSDPINLTSVTQTKR